MYFKNRKCVYKNGPAIYGRCTKKTNKTYKNRKGNRKKKKNKKKPIRKKNILKYKQKGKPVKTVTQTKKI